MKLFKLVFVVFMVGAVGLAIAQESQEPVVDPLTGQIIEQPAEAEKPQADLSEANGLVREQMYVEAEAILAELQTRFPDDPDLLMMRGELLNALKRPDDAIDVLKKTAELDPERKRLHFQLGSAYAATGHDAEAIEAFGRELEINDEQQVLSLARLNRAFLYQKQESWKAAADELEAVLVAEPQRTPVYGELMRLYLQLDDADAAIDVLERGDAAGYRSAAHWYSVGARLYKDEEFAQAVDLFNRSLAIDPDLAEAHLSLAESLVRLERGPEAIAHFERYLELEPDAEDAERVRAELEAIPQS